MNKSNKKKTDQNIPILKGEGLFQGYQMIDHYLEVLNNISIEIYSGDMVAITGMSGSGKSTLLNILAGLDRPKNGSVWFENQNLVELTESHLASLRNENMGFIFQQHLLIRELSAIENVMLPGLIYPKVHGKKIIVKELKTKAEYLLEKIGLADRKNHMIGELSGGESQRTAIARALILNPKIVFADEPTGNLDEKNSLETFQLLREMTHEFNSSIVMVTHSKALTQLCDRIYRIVDKQITLL